MVVSVNKQSDGGFDGIICLGGEDWWYHNRGHFDFQIMRRLAKTWPILFVNSLGVRMPSLRHDRQFTARIGRKLKSFARGLVEAEPGFWVYSPVSMPGRAKRVSDWALAPQIRLAARRAGIRRPLLWVHCPAGADLIGQLGETRIVLQRTDRFEAFPEADGAVVAAQIECARAAADLVVFAAPHLLDEEQHQVRDAILIDHGVDLDRFVAAGMQARAGTLTEPADMTGIARPRIGFIGGIDAHTFGPELFNGVVAQLPDLQFVMVGGCSLPEGWCPAPNVQFLGRKPYDDVARYMAAMDVLIMPWNDSEWIRACNPIKLKEYLAVGKPIVTTDFRALDPWREFVSVAGDAETFAAAIARAAQAGNALVDMEGRLARLGSESWDAKTETLVARLQQLGSNGTTLTSREAKAA